MRKLFNEFFYIPQHGKVREKVMLTRIAMTVTIVIMCLAAMSITAYAYFSYNITSGSNIIKSASFYTDVTVQITAEDGTAVDTITTNTSDHKSHSAELSANKTYTITVKHNDRFCFFTRLRHKSTEYADQCVRKHWEHYLFRCDRVR